MTDKKDARIAALHALKEIRVSGAWSDRAVSDALEKITDGREKALAARLIYGVVSRSITLDECIARVSGKPISRIEPLVLDLLRVGAYQLYYTDRIPAYAAVNACVEIAKKRLPKRVVPFVNAVMRKMADTPLPDYGDNLSLKTSHPEWLCRKLTEQEGFDRAAAFLAGNNDIPPLCIVRKPDICEQIERSGDVRELPGFEEGEFLVADAGALEVVKFADPRDGEMVLDACAAPGGKSVLMHWRAPNAELTACDLYDSRVLSLRETLKKYRVPADVRVQSAARNCEEFSRKFDLVLGDAPCSGVGVIRKKPDIRHKKQEDIESLPEIQMTIIENLAEYVKPGGRLIYATCTVLTEENRGVVDRFLKNRGDFILEEDKQLWPPLTDGFYMARLRRC